MQVAKWGNSLAIRIPAEVARTLGWQEGDEVDLAVGDDRTAVVTRRRTKAEALAQIRSMRVLLPADFKFDREEANNR